MSYLERRNRNLLGQDRKRMMISMVNHALQTHSTKKKAWWALVWYLSKVQAVLLYEVRTVMLRITGTRMSGWVLRQKETMETTMKNTEITPITCNKSMKFMVISSSRIITLLEIGRGTPMYGTCRRKAQLLSNQWLVAAAFLLGDYQPPQIGEITTTYLSQRLNVWIKKSHFKRKS